MTPALENLLISLVASVITGVAIWLWNRARHSRTLIRKSSFFGIRPGESCLIVMNHHPLAQNMMSHGDIETLVEAVKIVHEVGGEVTVAPFDKAIEPAGSITEFCIGSPASNQRTGVHIKNYLKDVSANPSYSNEPDSLAIVTGGQEFKYERGGRQYALLAKLRPNSSPHPVFLISGQTALGNKAAVYYLAQNYDQFLRKKYADTPFCLIIGIKEPKLYGYKSVELVRDITATALPAV